MSEHWLRYQSETISYKGNHQGKISEIGVELVKVHCYNTKKSMKWVASNQDSIKTLLMNNDGKLHEDIGLTFLRSC